jgi:hypothetical protein
MKDHGPSVLSHFLSDLHFGIAKSLNHPIAKYVHSYRSATMGSTFVARRAGM